MFNGAAPGFEVEGGLLLAAGRGLWLAALLSAFGSLVFRSVVLPRCTGRMEQAAAAMLTRRLDRLAGYSLGSALLAGLAWFGLQGRALADAATVQQWAAALPLAAHTMFARVLALQGMALLIASALHAGRRSRMATATCSLAVMLQAGHGHALAMDSGFSWLLLAGVTHLLGAGAWLGGLLPFLVVVREAPARAAATAARYFTPLGKLCVVAVAGSAAIQAWVMIGTVPAVAGTAYGWMALVKLALFGALLWFAFRNRYRLAPALLRADPAAARRALGRSVALQTAAGVAVIAAASVLSSLPPSMHVQPVWPFTQQFSLVTVNEDPDFKREALWASLAAAASLALLATAILRRRPRGLRGICLAASGVLAWLAVPHLGPLFVEAYPTSFATSPTGFAATSIAQGAALFPRHCAGCHGVEGAGDGPARTGLPEPPADLTADHLWMHSDGELFWWLSNGMQAPDGRQAMPGFAAALSEDERWALIDTIRATNAGVKRRMTGGWTPPLQAPAFTMTCAGQPVALADLRGRFLRLIFPGVPSDPATVVVRDQRCTASDSAVPSAYAVVAGIPLPQLGGTEFLIDPDGWLRAMQRPGGAANWDDPAVLASEVKALSAHPIHAMQAHTMPSDGGPM